MLLFDVGRACVDDAGAMLARDPLEGREQFRQRPALGHVALHAPGVERDAARVNDQRVALELQRSDDDLRGADQLADAE